MRILVGAGGLETYAYETGDLVRLTRNEDGPIVTAFAGDWGRVTRVHPCGAVDIKLAGYGRARDATMTRAVAVPRGRVEPCDHQGMPLRRGFAAVWDTRRPR
ncbi:hypothetical protein [Falsiroseomonas sp. CW058]|uniref:hypothetical protein n=1 Tax=Falsiroseomonas sp. CW058 TaxID=3388664 RepID=UPI003D311B08